MSKVAEQIACDAWQMCQIAMLAVAKRKPREDTKDLRIPLRAENGIGFREVFALESWIRFSRALAIAANSARSLSSGTSRRAS